MMDLPLVSSAFNTPINNTGSVVASDTDIHMPIKMTACGRCSMCKSSYFNTNSTYTSFVTGRSFSVTTKGAENLTFTCKARNLIYLITCTKCSVQYVGMTTQQINTRFNQHRYNILKQSLNTILVKHFNSEDHHYGNLSIQIIDYVEDPSEDVTHKLRSLLDEDTEHYLSLWLK